MHRLRFVTFSIFAAQFALLDLFFRGPRMFVDRPIAIVFALESVIVWGVLAALASRARSTRIVLALFASAIFGLQAFLYRYLQAPLDVQIADSALHSWYDVKPIILKNLPHVGLISLVAFAIGVALLELAPRFTPRFQHGAIASVVVAGLLNDDPRHASSDIRGLHALRALRREKPPPVVGAIALPPLHTERTTLPNVLFVLTESVRAQDYTSETAPETSVLFPNRVDLYEMRSVASYTVVSLSALVTGRSQEASRDDILRAANIFDVGHAAGSWVSYHSAHSRETFETKDVRAAVDRFVTLEDLANRDNVDDDSDLIVQDLDKMIIDRFIADLPRATRPKLAMLHVEGTHAPYFFQDADARFTPWDRVIAWSRMPTLRNAYKNSIYVQDRELARAVKAFVASCGNAPWVVVFTSDHGEAFGEHGAIHHGQGLHDEQVHVPGWIAAGNGAFDDAQWKALAAHTGRFVTHLDVLPTILDAMGLWDNYGLRPHREAMRGHSLLRAPVDPQTIVPITNCTTMFHCVMNTWGLLAGDRKLISQTWDNGWWCFDLNGGEHVAPASDPACTKLREESRRLFPVLPNGAPNR